MLKSVDNVQQAVTSSLQLRDNVGAHLSLLTHILIWPAVCLFLPLSVCLLSVYLPDVEEGSWESVGHTSLGNSASQWQQSSCFTATSSCSSANISFHGIPWQWISISFHRIPWQQIYISYSSSLFVTFLVGIYGASQQNIKVWNINNFHKENLDRGAICSVRDRMFFFK